MAEVCHLIADELYADMRYCNSLGYADVTHEIMEGALVVYMEVSAWSPFSSDFRAGIFPEVSVPSDIVFISVETVEYSTNSGSSKSHKFVCIPVCFMRKIIFY